MTEYQKRFVAAQMLNRWLTKYNVIRICAERFEISRSAVKSFIESKEFSDYKLDGLCEVWNWG